MTLEDRLMEKITPEPNSGCWIWLGSDDGGDGYGRIVVDGKQRQAHRVSYEHFVGPIPAGLLLDHLCRVRCCINPAHLEPVTSGENTRRGFVGSEKHDVCKRGHSMAEHAVTRRNGSRACGICLRDGLAAYRAAHPYQKKGRRKMERHPQAKLTGDDVRKILRMKADGLTDAQIAECFGISRSHAGNVARGVTWKHITITEVRKAL